MDWFFTWLDYPDVGESVGFYAQADPSEEGLWHGQYELYYRSSQVLGSEAVDFVLGERDIRVPPDEDPETFLRETCDDGEAPSIPSGVQDKWTIDSDLCEMSRLYGNSEMTLREMMAEYEDGLLLELYDEYAEFAASNGWRSPID